MTQVFKTPCVFIFIESFISARSFELLSGFLSFRLAGLTWVLPTGQGLAQAPQLLFIWGCLNFSHPVKDSFTGYRILGWQSFFFFFFGLWINQPSLWPPKLLKEICPWSWGSFLTNVLFFQVLSTLCQFPRTLDLKYSLIKYVISVREPGLQLISW